MLLHVVLVQLDAGAYSWYLKGTRGFDNLAINLSVPSPPVKPKYASKLSTSI